MKKKIIICFALSLVAIMIFSSVSFAVDSDVADVVEETWHDAEKQIKKVVNNVVFPIIDLILAIMFFIKIAMSYMEYKKHGQFDLVQPAILFISLVFALTAPLYLWNLI